MIYILTTGAHNYTHQASACGDSVRLTSYDALFAAKGVEAGTWIFTDLDRLGFWDLELAARIYRILSDAGLRVLNNPAVACKRFSLLRRLKLAGLNSFSVWRVGEGEQPGRYPVFIRTQSAHRGVLSDLINDKETLVVEIDRYIRLGYPASDLMVVEYCAQPSDSGIFRKLAAYRVGARIVPALFAHERHWVSKYGTQGIAGQDMYDEEYRIVQENPFAGVLMQAFEIGNIEYGRIDFGLVDGRVEVYEINTNPTVLFPDEHPFPVRLQSSELSKRLYRQALAAIDTPASGRVVEISIDTSNEKFQRDHRVVVSRLTP
jgi:hypothetical protein